MSETKWTADLERGGEQSVNFETDEAPAKVVAWTDEGSFEYVLVAWDAQKRIAYYELVVKPTHPCELEVKMVSWDAPKTRARKVA